MKHLYLTKMSNLRPVLMMRCQSQMPALAREDKDEEFSLSSQNADELQEVQVNKSMSLDQILSVSEN